MSALSRVLRDQRGFTLTELLVVATVLGLILAGVVFIQMQGQQAYLFGSHRVEAQQNNRSALELMVKELRTAQSITTIPPSPTDIIFVDENGVTVRYQKSGTKLNRTIAGATTALIGGVQTLTLSYFQDYPGTPATTAAAVRFVRLQLVTGTEDQVSGASPANQHATMESLVRLRNIP